MDETTDTVPVITTHVCPECGHLFTPSEETRKRALMAWSDKRGTFLRTLMTRDEFMAYEKRGSVD